MKAIAGYFLRMFMLCMGWQLLFQSIGVKATVGIMLIVFVLGWWIQHALKKIAAITPGARGS